MTPAIWDARLQEIATSNHNTVVADKFKAAAVAALAKKAAQSAK